ncbi:MAG: hypothetical protein AAF206_03245 [Bacteroidota bacterium]
MHLTQYFLTLVILFSCQFLAAQQSLSDRAMSTWFLEERFLIADANNDALLDRDELNQFPQEFVYFLVDRHYQLTDQNRDGKLSFNEINTRQRSENIYFFNEQRKNLRKLASEYPLLAQADKSYLLSNPELVKGLFGNLVWLYDHPQLAATVFNDRAWMANHPEAMICLQKNLRWMAANPGPAKNLYRDRTATQRLPELLGWRADHKAFLRSNPKISHFNKLDFIPEGIRINKR